MPIVGATAGSEGSSLEILLILLLKRIKLFIITEVVIAPSSRSTSRYLPIPGLKQELLGWFFGVSGDEIICRSPRQLHVVYQLESKSH